MEVVFFGSGPVAADCLKLLLEQSNFRIETVITKPKPHHHKGSTPVLDLCQQRKINHRTPSNKKELDDLFASEFKKNRLSSPAGLVIDYGIIISQEVINYFDKGIVNSHFSLLPEWRGADPITFSILSGQTQTGVSLMLINQRLDEGQLLAQDKISIQTKETTATLTQKLIQLSHDMLTTHLANYLSGSLTPYPQIGTPTYSRKLTKNDGVVDWSKPAAVLEREVRAFLDWPKSRAKLGKHEIILKQVDVIKATGEPGDYEITAQKDLVVFCGKEALKIITLQPPGKKEMPAQSFMAGYSL